MADKLDASLPVVSDNVHDEFVAAFARIAQVPVHVGLISDMTAEDFLADIDDSIEVGSDKVDEALDNCDADVRLCA